MKKIFSLFAAVLFAGSMIAADPVVLTFSDWGDTSLNKDNKPANTAGDFGTVYTTTSLIDSLQGAAGFVTCSATSKCYAGRVGYGCKLGSSSAIGSFTLDLVTPAEFDSIVVNCSSYSAKEGSLSINGGEAIDLTDEGASNKVLRNVTYVPAGEVSSLTIATTALRAYVKSITFFPKEGEVLEGWNNTAVFSKTQIASIADLEGITLTLAGASLELLDESDFGGIYLQDEQGSDIYAICHPLLGGNFAINGDVVTLTGWSTTDDYCVNLPSESATLYFSDYGCFSIDGEPEYFSDDDIAISYIAAEATTYTVTYTVNGFDAEHCMIQAGYFNEAETVGDEFVAGANTVPENVFAYISVVVIDDYTVEVKVDGAPITLTDGMWYSDVITADMTIDITFTAPGEGGNEQEGVLDVIKYSYFIQDDATASSYQDFTYTSTLGATYKAHMMLQNGKDSLQIRSTMTASTYYSGIVNTVAPEGKYIKSVKVEWHSATADTRQLNIALADAPIVINDMYERGFQPDYTTVKSAGDATINIEGEHQFIGFCSQAGAMYIKALTIEWADKNNTPTGLNNIEAQKAVKALENGKVVILRNGVRYNVVGMQF